MVIRFLQLLFWGIQFRLAYMRIDIWYWTAKLSGKLANAACDKFETANAEIDDLIEILHQMDDLT